MHCDNCDALKAQVAVLEMELKDKTSELSRLKEFIHLNALQLPAVSVKDDSSGAFF
jgi:hypothetical protein